MQSAILSESPSPAIASCHVSEAQEEVAVDGVAQLRASEDRNIVGFGKGRARRLQGVMGWS